MTRLQGRWLEVAERALRDRKGLCYLWSGRLGCSLVGPLRPFIKASGGIVFLRPFATEPEGRLARSTFACLLAAMTDTERAEIGLP